jgi:hypothetical protein
LSLLSQEGKGKERVGKAAFGTRCLGRGILVECELVNFEWMSRVGDGGTEDPRVIKNTE